MKLTNVHLSSLVRRVAGHAGDARDAAEHARTLADRGAQAVAHATEAMSAVRKASEQATDAIGALDGKSERDTAMADQWVGSPPPCSRPLRPGAR
jgi:hypothetical protein